MISNKIAIIGAGAVGASIAYTLMLKNATSEILLVDISPEIVEGQVLDLSDTACVSSSKIKVSSYEEASQAEIIVITAGAKQKDGEARTNLVGRNYKILEFIIEKMMPIRSDAILLMVSNPVDIMTQIAHKLSGLPRNQVFGSGTYLDTTRLCSFLSGVLNVDTRSIHAYVLGEHGDSQFIAWGASTIAGKPLLEFREIQKLNKREVQKNITGKALSIIKLKGATYYGIGACAADLCECIILNKHKVLPLSVYIPSLDCYLSMPAKLGQNGIEDIYDIPLTKSEAKSLKLSASSINTYLSGF